VNAARTSLINATELTYYLSRLLAKAKWKGPKGRLTFRICVKTVFFNFCITSFMQPSNPLMINVEDVKTWTVLQLFYRASAISKFLRHFQPGVHHICMSDSLPCINCILSEIKNLTSRYATGTNEIALIITLVCFLTRFVHECNMDQMVHFTLRSL